MTANNIWQWFQENEASSGGVTDKIQNYLTAAGYTGATNEALYRWLGARGYTGSLADRIYQFEYFNTFRYIDISAKLVLEKYGTDAHVWIPGIGYFNGLQAGNYIDSAGTQAGLVDNPVGLVMDAEGSLGAELVPTDYLTNTARWSVVNATISIVNGKPVFTSTAATAISAILIGSALPNPRIYSGTYRISQIDSGRTVARYMRGANVGNDATTSQTSFNVTSTNTNEIAGFQMAATAAGQTFTIDNISVREVTGAITATQGTTANKPILRRGAVNLLTYSEEFNNAPWSSANTVTANAAIAPNASVTADEIDANGATSYGTFQAVTLSGSTVYTASIYLKNVDSSKSRIGIYDVTGVTFLGIADFTWLDGAPTYSLGSGVISNHSEISVGNGWWRITVTFTTTTNTSYRIYLYPDGTTTTGSVYSWGAQLELGSTASEYIPTTSAAASSTSGDYYWQFDGSNDSLALSAVPFVATDDLCVVLAARTNELAATARTAFGFSGAAGQRLAMVYNESGYWYLRFVDDSATTYAIQTTTQLAAGSIRVVSARKSSNVRILKLNGTQEATSNTPVGTTTVTGGSIGARDAASAAPYLGSIYPVIAIKGTVTDADLLTLERWVGSLSGVSI